MNSENKPREREVWKPGTMVYPVPAALVSCGSTEQERNLLTVSWIGTICTNPAMLSVSVRPERHSHPIICREMEFSVNLTTVAMCRATDWCGVKSGAEFDKWKESGFTPVKGVKNSCWYVDESPLVIECRVKDIIHLGSHDMFIAEVLDVLADKSLIDPETGAFDLRGADLVAYCHGGYYALGELLGRFGYSVKKKK